MNMAFSAEQSMTVATTDPFELFRAWYALATEQELNDPNAMTVATATTDGKPSARMVLLKDWDARGFVFYTNLGSRKGQELGENPQAHLLFHWKSLRRQVRVDGAAQAVSAAEADAYFASRARDSRLGAWASQQSQTLPSRATLVAAIAKTTARYPVGDIPRPDFWSGFRIVPQAIEFWEDGAFRIHHRRLFERNGTDWTERLLYP
jgi:pyridoxamine 5'-phosphate oxidase